MFKIAFSIVLMSLLLVSCFDTEEYKLSYVQKKQVDSLFHKMHDSLKIEVDSVCNARYEHIYTNAIDSIRKLRYEEIEELQDL